MSDRQTVIDSINSRIETLERVVDGLNEGDRTFSEAGDWLHNCGDWIVSALEDARDRIEEESRTLDELCALLSDSVGETGKSEGAVEVLSRLLTELAELRRAARDFVDKVDRGEARSVRSYLAFKAALGEEEAV